jgi:hypothetical protein
MQEWQRTRPAEDPPIQPASPTNPTVKVQDTEAKGTIKEAETPQTPPKPDKQPTTTETEVVTHHPTVQERAVQIRDREYSFGWVAAAAIAGIAAVLLLQECTDDDDDIGFVTTHPTPTQITIGAVPTQAPEIIYVTPTANKQEPTVIVLPTENITVPLQPTNQPLPSPSPFTENQFPQLLGHREITDRETYHLPKNAIIEGDVQLFNVTGEGLDEIDSNPETGILTINMSADETVSFSAEGRGAHIYEYSHITQDIINTHLNGMKSQGCDFYNTNSNYNSDLDSDGCDIVFERRIEGTSVTTQTWPFRDNSFQEPQ